MKKRTFGRARSLTDRYFDFLERRSAGDRLHFHIVLIAVLASFFLLVFAANTKYLTTVPSRGGTLVEGIVGTPRFVNPVLAITRADHDMVALVYSGLMKLDTNGNLVPDLAKSVTLSPDGKTYHIVLKQGITFQDGTPLTSADVAFTIGLIQNPQLKSPLRGNWDGVTVDVKNKYELDITLPQPYAPFIQNLTVGILPRARWENIPIEQIPFSQNNTEPIGTGPYYVSDALRSKSGLITGYKLSASPTYTPHPQISTLVFNFYQSEHDLLSALHSGAIASTPSLSAEGLAQVNTNKYRIIESPLPRTFEVFFNQNKSTALRDLAARRALNEAVDRPALVKQVLDGHGIPITGPVPPGFIDIKSTSSASTTQSTDRIKAAAKILTDGGWKKDDTGTWVKTINQQKVSLELTLSTANTPLFEATAKALKQTWEKLGVRVTIAEFEQPDLVQNVIRPRDFQVLLFGTDIGSMVDLYPFWHSSQKDDPGLNIGEYTNIDVDSLLEKERVSTSTAQKATYLSKISNIIKSEVPAVFLFTPTFSYVIDKGISVPPFTHLGDPSDRFANIALWHVTSNRVWPVFTSAK